MCAMCLIGGFLFSHKVSIDCFEYFRNSVSRSMISMRLVEVEDRFSALVGIVDFLQVLERDKPIRFGSH